MQRLSDILTTKFRPLPCDFCPSVGPTYRDPETGCLYCLPCLELATDAQEAAQWDGPEDAEVIAFGRAALDELLPTQDGRTTARVAA